ncbi:MAG: hypothetical protein V4714_06670 [Bacteroidota bacterium]
MSANKKHLALYNTQLKEREEIIRDFVVRQDTFQKLFSEIQSAPMQRTEQHYLLVGQRGMGKTTMLHRLAIAIEDDPKLKTWLIPVVLNEEQYNITELANLWETVADTLGELDEEHFGDLFDQMETQVQRKDYERFSFDLLTKRLSDTGKKIVVFLDNFGNFLEKLGDLEARQLREILMTNNQIRLIAASSVMLEPQFSYEKPFWEFFHVIQLEGLSRQEAPTLLLQLAENMGRKEMMEKIIQHSPARIEVLRRLTGGVLRTTILLFEIFLDNESGSALNDLEAILDHVSPLFKHRMDDLSTQQQKIVDAVARHWDAVSVKEIAARTRLESKLVSAQLKLLYQNRIIDRITTSTKNHLYQLNERFFNIWYLMRYGKRKDQTRVIWLVKFLEAWCDGNELEHRLERHIRHLQDGTLPAEQLLFMTEVYCAMEKTISSEKRQALIKVALETLPNALAKHLSASDQALYMQGEALLNAYRYSEAISLFLKSKNKTGQVYLITATTYISLGEYDKAKEFYLKAYKTGDATSLWFLAFFLVLFTGRKQESLKYFRLSLDKLKENYPIGALISTYIFPIRQNNKNEADNLYREVYEQYRTTEVSYFYSRYLIGNNEIESGISIVDEIINKDEFIKLEEEKGNLIFILLLAKKQTQVVYRIFEESQLDLKERLKPIWYALMYLMQDEFPDEYRRMGSELKETVDEILQQVKEKQEKET